MRTWVIPQYSVSHSRVLILEYGVVTRYLKVAVQFAMSCSCYCCRKPRYKRLVDALYPEDPQDTTLVASNLDKLLYFASSSPEHLDRVGDYLALRLRRSLNRDRRG